MSSDTTISKMTPGTCPVWPGIQSLGDVTVAPEGPNKAAALIAPALAAGATRAEILLEGTATGPGGTTGYTILPAAPGTAHFTPLLTDTKTHDTIGVLECVATVYVTHPERGCGCIGLSRGVYVILRRPVGTCGFCGVYVARDNGQWTDDSGDTACAAPTALFGRHARKPDALRDVPALVGGSGKVTCCGHHRQRCTRGGHQWATWVKNGELQRTPGTLYCHRCSSACTAGETIENT